MVNLIPFWATVVAALLATVLGGVLSWFWFKREVESWGGWYEVPVHALLMIPLFIILLVAALIVVPSRDTKAIEDYYGISEIRTEYGHSVRRSYFVDRRLNVTWRDGSKLKSGVLDFAGNKATLYVWDGGFHKLSKVQ